MKRNIAEELRMQGFRWTAQRQAILNTLRSTKGHLTVENLIHKLQPSYPNLNVSTVYRTLELFERTGLAEHVHVGHGSAEWKFVSDVELDQHHHLVCEQCGWSRPLTGKELKTIRKTIQSIGAAELSPHFAITCLCPKCTAK